MMQALMRSVAVLGTAAAIAFGSATPASAVITQGSPGLLTADNTKVEAVFLLESAADTSILSMTGFPTIFNNGSNNVGDVFNITPLTVGQTLDFRLTNTTTTQVFDAGVAYTEAGSPPDWYHFAYLNHAGYVANFGAIAAAAQTAMDAIDPNMNNWIFVAVEDHNNGPVANNYDRDWNDLVFAFHNVSGNVIPEPATLALLGAGLVGLGMVRRRKA